MASFASTSTAPIASPQAVSTKERQGHNQEATLSRPVEMRTLQPSIPSTPAIDAAQTAEAPAAASPDIPMPHTAQSDSATRPQPTLFAPEETSLPTSQSRTDIEAIGPSTDTPAANPDNTNGPVLVIMLLLTTGARHPYKIDEKYLQKRNVSVEAMDPYNISVYTLKELIWRDWREEWETRPTSPTSIRLIHFGRMLDDKSPLKDCRFQTDTPNVVHMTVKPQEVVDEEENAKSGKIAGRTEGEDEPTAGCRCVIL